MKSNKCPWYTLLETKQNKRNVAKVILGKVSIGKVNCSRMATSMFIIECKSFFLFFPNKALLRKTISSTGVHNVIKSDAHIVESKGCRSFSKWSKVHLVGDDDNKDDYHNLI